MQSVVRPGESAPVLECPPTVGSPRNIVVALDPSDGSCTAVSWTLDHLYRNGDVLHLLHVIPSFSSMTPASGLSLAHVMPPEEDEQEVLASHALRFIEQHFLVQARERGAAVAVDLVHGRCNQAISDAICSKVDNLAATVVVLSVRKRSLLESWLQVPVNQQVAARCSRPTLIFKE